MPYPFSRANPSDWTAPPVLTAAQLNQMDRNAAEGADGTLWTDVTILRNFVSESVQPAKALVYQPSTHRWIASWEAAGEAAASYSRNGKNWHNGTVPLGVLLVPSQNAIAANESVVIFGGTPDGVSVEKFARSDDGGTTWTIEDSSQSTAIGIAGIAWVPGLSLFVAVHADNGLIETSPDGITWTQRYSEASVVWRNVATNGSRIVALGGGADAVKYSDNGIDWFSGTGIPNLSTWQAVHFNPSLGFVAFGFEGHFFTSADGATWVAHPSFGDGSLLTSTVFRRLLVIASVAGAEGQTSIAYSTNGLVWTPINMIPTTNVIAIGASDGQLLLSDSEVPQKVYSTMAGGF